MGLVKVVPPVEGSCSTDVMSDRVGRSSNAETRGKSDLDADDVEDTTCVNGEEARSDWRRGETFSGTVWLYCACAE